MNDIKDKHPKGAGKSSFELIDTDIFLKNVPIKEDSVILDLACGRGAYSLFMSDIVGENGLIYAVDLWEEGLLLLEEEINEKRRTKIFPFIANATKEIDIDDNSLDICLMATVLHDFDEMNKTDSVLKSIKRLLRPNGYLAVIEFKKILGPPGPPIDIRLSEADTEKIVSDYGFKKVTEISIGEYNYLMTFRSIS